jgi:hypothetical protein
MKLYFCFLEHFATGEGLTYCMAIVGSENEENAKKEFVRKYMCNELVKEKHIQDCVDYFSVGMDVYEWHETTHHDKIKDIMKTFFTQSVIDIMFDAEKAHALHEFNFKLYNNYS